MNNQASNNESTLFNTIVLHEHVPKTRVKNAMSCDKDIVPIDEKQKLNKYSKTFCQNFYRTDYQWPSAKEWGRVKQTPYTGLGTLYSPLRGYLANGIYLDIDVVNCHPTLLQHEFKKQQLDTSIIDEYVNDRESFCIREKIDKTTFCTMINMEAFKHPSVKVMSLHRQIYKTFIPSVLSTNKDIMSLINKSRADNKLGKFIGNYLQSKEFEILVCLYKFSLKHDIMVDVLMHDGFFARITEIVNENYLNSMFPKYAAEVKEKFGLELKFKIKPHDLSLKIPNIEDQTPLEIHTEALLAFTKEESLRKFGTTVYKRKNDHPMYYEDYYNDYNIMHKDNPKTLKDFANEVFREAKLYNSKMAYSNELVEYLTMKRDFEEFPEKLSNSNYIAFKNGTLQLHPLKFFDFEEIELLKLNKFIARTYIDTDFTGSKETPKLDQLLSAQLNEESYTTLRILIGRLFFNLNVHDNWQVAPYILGDPHTGKSTLLNLITHLMGTDNVGTLTKNDKVFQLSAVYNKDITIVPDIRDCKEYIDEDVLQTVISGERTSIRMMRTTPFSHVWNKPIMFGSNYKPDWSDSEGALRRRLVIFSFTNQIEQKDSSLYTQITNESDAIINRCISEYFSFIEEHPKEADFNKYIGEELQNLKNDFKEYSDPLSEFLALGRQRAGDYSYSIVYKEGTKSLVSNFKKRFENWLSGTKHDQSFRLNTKHIEFKKNGFVYCEEKVCKACGNKHAKGCCVDYNRLNRTTAKYYENMHMVKESVSQGSSFVDDQ